MWSSDALGVLQWAAVIDSLASGVRTESDSMGPIEVPAFSYFGERGARAFACALRAGLRACATR